MTGYCKNCKMSFDGKTCPLCHGSKDTNAKPISIGIVIVGIVVLIGFLVYTGGIQIDQEKLEESIEMIPNNIQDVSDTVEGIASETSEKLSETITKNIKIPDIESTVNQITEKVNEIKESAPETNLIKNPLNSKPVINILELESQIHDFTNIERQKNNLSTFSYDSKIAGIARQHSLDMTEKNYFEHTNSYGVDAPERGISAGYENCGDPDAIKIANNLEYYMNGDIPTYNNYVMQFNQLVEQGKLHSGFAENIAQNWLYTSYMTKGIELSYDWQTQEELAHSIVQLWMNSPGHRENILSYHQSEGIGISISDDYAVYATQDFC